MATASKSSQTAKNVVLALLALWSVVSLIIIVVWATSPDLKSSARCRAELQDVTEKLEGAKVVFGKNMVAVEQLLEDARNAEEKLKADFLVLVGRLNETNATLEECRQENVVLNWNISALQEKVELLRQTEANLTTQIGLQQDHIEALQQNVTEASHQTETCVSLRTAAESQMMAAQSQTRACESRLQYQQKQLQKCKEVESEAPKDATQQQADGDSSSAPALSGIPALMLLVCSALHLITCEYPEH